MVPSFIVVALFLFSNTKIARYQLYQCQYDLLWGDAGRDFDNVNVVSVTNSRGMVAINAEVMRDALIELAPAEGNLRFWDIGKAWRGAEFTERLVRDLLESKKVDVLLVEFNLAAHESVRYHERSKYFLTLWDLTVLLMREQRDSVWVRISSLLKLFAERLTLLTETVLKGDFIWEPSKFEEKSVANHAECSHTPRLVDLASMDTRRASDFAKNWETRDWKWDLHSTEQRLSTEYFVRIAKIAKENGVKLAFFQVPEYFEPTWNQEFVRSVEDLTGAPLLSVNQSYRENLHVPGNYHDPTHFTDERSTLFSKWLAKKTVDLFYVK